MLFQKGHPIPCTKSRRAAPVDLYRKNAARKRSSKSDAQDLRCYSIDQPLYDAKLGRKSNAGCRQ